MPPFREIVIVGCGVSGLSSGIRLLEQFPVTIIAKELPPSTTSDVAGAFFEPYEAYPRERVLHWSKISLSRFRSLANIADTGVSISPTVYLAKEKMDPHWWWQQTGLHYRAATASELAPGFTHGLVAHVPKIETQAYMPFLMNRFVQAGGTVEQLDHPLENVYDLCKNNRLIVNCTGLGARTFSSDPGVYPIRGQVMRIKPLGIGPEIRDYTTKDTLTYIIPRADGCIFGGTHELNNWSVEPDSSTAKDILERCRQLTGIDSVHVIEHRVGLRPGRAEVRLETEPTSASCAIIHNYGHGGAGFTLSWGCAEEVLQLATAFESA